MWRLLGDIATHPDRFDAESGAAHYREALLVAQRQGTRPLVAHCHLGLGRLYRNIGETERAREHFTTATTMYGEMDMGFWLDQAKAEMANSGDEQRVHPSAKISPSDGNGHSAIAG